MNLNFLLLGGLAQLLEQAAGADLGDTQAVGFLADDPIDAEDRAAHLSPEDLASMPKCTLYKKTTESCDPFAQIGRCRWCIMAEPNTKRNFVTKQWQSLTNKHECPSYKSIRAAYRNDYYWHLIPTAAPNAGRICVILHNKDPTHTFHAQKLETPEVAEAPAPAAPAYTEKYIIIAVASALGLVALLGTIAWFKK